MVLISGRADVGCDRPFAHKTSPTIKQCAVLVFPVRLWRLSLFARQQRCEMAGVGLKDCECDFRG